MGWLVKYTGPNAEVDVPSKGVIPVKTGDTFDIIPMFIRALVMDPAAPWERIKPDHPDYVLAEERK